MKMKINNKKIRKITAMTLALGMMTGTAISFASTNGSSSMAVTLPSGEEVMIEQYGVADTATIEGTVVEIYETKASPAYLIKDDHGYVVFNTTLDTIANVALDEIKVGDTVAIGYNGIMTASLPAQGTAISIEKLNSGSEIADEDLNYDVIREVHEDKEANIFIAYPQIANFPGELLMDYINQPLGRIALSYGSPEAYENVNIDYEITRMDNDVLSVLFKGTADMKGFRTVDVTQSVNIDMATSNEISYHNLVKDDQAVRLVLDEKAKEQGLNGLEAEGIRVYFTEDAVVFYYMPLDDSATEFINLEVSMAELEGLINTDFGPMPAS